MSTELFPGRKDGQCIGLTTLPLSYADSLDILETSTFWSSKACLGL